MIPYGKQSINQDDIQAVVKVLKSDFLTQGPSVIEFEDKICKYTGSKYGVATNSGTSALHIACLALGLKTGDWLWTTPITFVASANCGLYCGAKIDFVDIDPHTWNISIEKLENKLRQARKENLLPKVLVAVHLCGLSCDMQSIRELSEKYGFRIIEDACHALGGKYHGLPIGNCMFSDIAVFSFHPVKAITTGEGGMAVCNDRQLAESMKLLRSHGITRDPNKMVSKPHGQWYYQQLCLGFNYRMTDIHAALGISQLTRLGSFIQRRHVIAGIYDRLLVDLPVKLPCYKNNHCFSGLHLYVIRLKLNEVNKSHKEIFENMQKQGIGVNLHYIPIHIQPWYKKLDFKAGSFPEAERYYSEAISLPMFPDLEEQQIKTVARSLKRSMD